jgi:hypothetical protein
MGWDAVSAVAELVGALAVIGTLIYLSVQIRDHTLSVRTQAHESIWTGFNDLNIQVVQNPDLFDAFLAGLYVPQTLDRRQEGWFALTMRCYHNHWMKMLRLYQAGAVPQSDWQKVASEAAQLLDTPGGKLFRQANRLFVDLYVELEPLYGRPAISSFYPITGEKDDSAGKLRPDSHAPMA